MVAGTGEWVEPEPQAGIARDARTRPAGTQPPFPGDAQKRLEHGERLATGPGVADGHDQVVGWSATGWAYLVSALDCCTREIVGWDLSLRCRTQDALAALHRALREVLPCDPSRKGLTLTTDNGTQFTSARFIATLGQLGITHRRTAYNHPEGNGRIERFHRSLKEEEVWSTNTSRSIRPAIPSPAGSTSTIISGLISHSRTERPPRPGWCSLNRNP